MVPFNGIAMIDAIFEKKFPDRFPAFKRDMLHLERKQFGWPLQYEQPGILGSGIPVPLFTEIFATKMRLEKKQTPHATSVKPSGIPAETFWFTTIEGLSVLTKATPSIDTFADMFPLLLQVEVYCKSTTLRFFGERICFFVLWRDMQKISRNSFQHSTAKKTSVHFEYFDH